MLTWPGAPAVREMSGAFAGGLRSQPQGYNLVVGDIKERERETHTALGHTGEMDH